MLIGNCYMRLHLSLADVTDWILSNVQK